MKSYRNPYVSMFLMLALGIVPLSLSAQETVPPKISKPTEPADNLVKVYPLRYSSAQSAAQVIGSLISHENAASCRLSVDERTNSIIISAPQAFHKEVLDLLQIVDQAEAVNPPAANSANHPVNVMVQMIMEADQGDWSENALPPEQGIQDILREVDDEKLFKPFKDPRVVASSIVRVNPRALANETGRRKASYMSSGKVFAESSSSQNTGRFAMNGMLTLGADNEYFLGCELKIELLEPAREGQAREDRKVLTARIESESTMVAKHPVLLSVNAIEGRNCVIIVEIR